MSFLVEKTVQKTIYADRSGIKTFRLAGFIIFILDKISIQNANHYALFLCLFIAASSIVPLGGEARTVRAGVFPAAPLVMIKDNKPQGLFIDLIEYFSKAADWQVEYVPGTWSELLLKLEKGEIDILPAVGYTLKRTAVYDFSKNPVYIDSGVLFTNPDFTPRTIFELKGKRVAALKGSIFTEGFITYINSFGVRCDIITTQDNKAVMEAISNGRADAGVCIYSLGNELAKEYNVKITPISFSPIALEFAVPKGRNADLIAEIDRIMPSQISNPDSLYSRSFRKWAEQRPPAELPDWLILVFFALLTAGFFLALWSYTLKRQVNSKTEYLKAEISERKKAEIRLRQSLDEKETLIRELYHRTKNTMQVIQSMVMLQAEEFPENEDLQLVVKNTGDRVRAIALVHKMLYKSGDLSHISTKEYIEELSSLILQSFKVFDDRITLNYKIEDQYLLLDTAIPFGLILNELITNSMKHAFPDNRKGVISINLSRGIDGKILLQYSDDGVGTPEGFDFKNQNTLGIKLIYSIAELQLMGTVTYNNSNGVSCTVEISTDLYKARV